MRALAVGLFLAFAGCIDAGDCPDDPVDNEAVFASTAARWEAEIGPLPSDYPGIKVNVRLVAAGDYSRDCKGPAPGRVVGCSWWDPVTWSYVIELVECRTHEETSGTLAHEYAHVLSHFVFGVPDGNHEDERIWGPVASRREIGR